MTASLSDPRPIHLHSGAPRGAYRARVARWVAHADRPLPGFSPAAPPTPAAPWVDAGPVTGERRGTAWIGGAERPFVVSNAAAVQRVTFPGLVGFEVARDGSAVRLGAGAVAEDVVVESLLGAGLVLALAQRDCFCLHASALARGARALLLLGPSGVGKSTLAAGLDGRAGWRRLTDDIAPVSIDAGVARIWPHFPQLKLPPQAWYPAAAAGGERVVAIACVERDGEATRSHWRELAPSEAARRVIAATAGARLFAPDTLAAHLAYCAALAQSVPVRVLRVPERPAALAALLDDVGSTLHGKVDG